MYKKGQVNISVGGDLIVSGEIIWKVKQSFDEPKSPIGTPMEFDYSILLDTRNFRNREFEKILNTKDKFGNSILWEKNEFAGRVSYLIHNIKSEHELPYYAYEYYKLIF